MTTEGPFALVRRVVSILDELGIPYALGGSMASSLVGEPRSTVDVDVAIQVDPATGEHLIERARAEFYVPDEAAREAIAERSSFNLLDTTQALKVDLFVLGEGLLDRMQIERRVLVEVPGVPAGIWITSAEDQVLRKLDWFRQTDATSDRQWRDVIGILRVHGGSIDRAYLVECAAEVGLAELLADALRDAGLANS
jgi:hypothetical protein